MKKKNIILKVVLVILFALGLFYLFLPALSFRNPGLYIYLLAIIFFQTLLFLPSFFNFKNQEIIFKRHSKNIGIRVILVMLILGAIILINFFNGPLFRSSVYANRITVDETKNFIDDVKPVDFKGLPLLDKDSSQKVGDRVMGQMPELVSQFMVSDLYTQINYNDEILRVTPLEYASAIKYFTNSKDGIKGYITVNSVNGEAKLVKLDKGMKIMPSALFNQNLIRNLRFKYPTLIFDSPTFEIDNDGNPYWIVPIISYGGIGLRKDIQGVVVLDPISGASTKYLNGEIPSWIDHVYSANLIIEQVDDWGLYQGGYFNSIFGQKGVVQTTDGYNYLTLNGDVYMYTGITSRSTDESNIGFILTNLRTKETHFYKVPGAEEYSAMASAEGQVQQMKYHSSFPLLINLNNRPTYLISLKDDAGLVKMYAFVDVVDYQKVVVTESNLGIEYAANKYLSNFKNEITGDKIIKNITIKEIKNVVIDGNTNYYITDNDNQKYRVSIKTNEKVLPFIKVNDVVNIEYYIESDVIEIIKIEWK